MIGIIIGIAATRIGANSGRRPGRVSRALGRVWAWILGVGVLGYLSLVPGTIILNEVWGVDNAGLVVGFTAVAFTALILALVAARARDRERTY